MDLIVFALIVFVVGGIYGVSQIFKGVAGIDAQNAQNAQNLQTIAMEQGKEKLANSIDTSPEEIKTVKTILAALKMDPSISISELSDISGQSADYVVAMLEDCAAKKVGGRWEVEHLDDLIDVMNHKLRN